MDFLGHVGSDRGLSLQPGVGWGEEGLFGAVLRAILLPAFSSITGYTNTEQLLMKTTCLIRLKLRMPCFIARITFPALPPTCTPQTPPPLTLPPLTHQAASHEI